MGSEQSTPSGSGGPDQRGRVATPVSPQNSICSDAEPPYVPYTQNLPIGDAEPARSGSSGRRPRTSGRLRPGRRPRTPKQIVVVRTAEEAAAGPAEEDDDVRRIRMIPNFLPIMRGALTLPGGRDLDALERLDAAAVRQMAGRLQRHLAGCAEHTAAQQAGITAQVVQIDQQVQSVLAAVTERQKAFARHAERLQKVAEVGHQLQRANMLLNETLPQLEQLNSQLPADQRLQPFLLTTG